MFYYIHLYHSVRRTHILYFEKPLKIFCGGEMQKLFCKDLSLILQQDLLHDRTCRSKIAPEDSPKIFLEPHRNNMTYSFI